MLTQINNMKKKRNQITIFSSLQETATQILKTSSKQTKEKFVKLKILLENKLQDKHDSNLKHKLQF